MSSRASPKDKPVSLFITCIIDLVYPQIGQAVVRLLEHLGVALDFPMAQTCCGQPGFNGGYRADARIVARQFLTAFRDAHVILTPSGSCAAMIRHEYPVLFAEDAAWRAQAERAAAITWEFTEYLVEGLGRRDLGLRLPEPETLAIHDACHGLRLLGLHKAARVLLASVGNVELADLSESDSCCGFGGLFAVKLPAISDAMLRSKIAAIESTTAQTIVTGDASCLMQMNGGLSRHGSRKRVHHIAEVLARGLPERQS